MKVLIDADSLIYSGSHKRGPDEAVQYLHEKIDQITERTEADEYALFLTLGPSFRNKIKTYKSNRTRERKSPVHYYLREYMISILEANYQDGVEADDLVVYWHRKDEDNTIIASPDKDITNIVKKSYNYQKDEVIERNDREVEELFWKQMLTGDSSDGVQGIPGMGPKGADKHIEKWLYQDRMGYSEITLLAYHLAYPDEYTAFEKFQQTYKQLKILERDTHFEINKLELPAEPKYNKAKHERKELFD